LTSFDRAMSLQPGFERAHFHRANTLHALKRLDEALASYDRVIALRPGFAEAFSNRGNVLQLLKRFKEALASYDRAIALQPDFALAHYNRGNVLQDLNRFEDALASYDRALALRPNFAEALSNRGNVLQRLKRFDEAVAGYDRAIALRPKYAEAFSNRGAALQQLKRHHEALASYDGAIDILPDYADAHFNKALCMLVLGDFDRGWDVHEWRWQTEQLRASKHNLTRPLWLGKTDIAGKTIFLHSEQGYGDTIQFCRYVPMVAARGARVILEVQQPVRRLMTSLAGATQVIARGDPLPDFDTYCPLLSLPLAFGTQLETIPAAVPYLHAAPQDVAAWDARLGPRTRPRIGLAWSGLPTHKNDHNRSVRLSALLPLLGADATFVSLHKDIRAEDAEVLKQRSDLLFFGKEIGDFFDTAALISNLDLVISVDTSVVHLAGALAKPVWVLLPFMPDWRWLLDREDNPWYPTARLFRQDGTHAWDGVIARVHAALRDFIRQSS
jgi:Tfp pilus assembly protein PilF